MAKMLYQFWSKVDLASPQFREDVPQHFHREQFGDGSFRYYYLDFETAALAAKADADVTFNPQQVWYYSVPTAQVMNVDTANFQSSLISRSCRVVTLRSKYRHEFHMIALPSIVASLATLMGIENPGFNLDELLVRNPIISPERSQELVGSVAAEKGVFEAPYYEDSILWKQRAALWAALGEPEPAKYLVGAVDKKGDIHDNTTEAKMLAKLLRVYNEEWEKPLYARFQMVADPRTGAVNKNGGRLSLPAITADLPAAWKEIGEEKWRVQVLPFTTQPVAMIKEGYEPDDFDATLEEMLAWVKWEKKVG